MGHFFRATQFIAANLIICAIYTIYADRLTSQRTDSLPYISGDTFRSHCKFILDETGCTISPSLVEPGDTIFVAITHLDEFFRKYYPDIKNPFILVSHNDDASVPGVFSRYLGDEKLYAWFTQNIDHPETNKLRAIPIGLENEHWARDYRRTINGLLQVALDQVKTSTQNAISEKGLLYGNFNISTYLIERQCVYNLFINKSFCLFESRRSVSEYLKQVQCHKFVLSPRGNGLDCIRTWEALYLGSIPIVKSSTLDPLYNDLPVLIIDDWAHITREFLEHEYERITHGTYQMKKLTFDYWWNIILQFQSNCRSKYFSHT